MVLMKNKIIHQNEENQNQMKWIGDKILIQYKMDIYPFTTIQTIKIKIVYPMHANMLK